MKYMLDTNICIYAIKKHPENILKMIDHNRIHGLCISAITLAELEHGISKSDYPKRNADALAQFLSIITVLPFGDSAAIEYGKICAYLQKKGTPIGTMDMLIAAHALSEELILVTNNIREFERIPTLTIENWI